jgi:glucose-1-phosphate thymidylyltransferase
VKALLPVGRPFLDYVLGALADGGVTDICLVVGPEHEGLRRRYSEDVEPERIRVSFAIQAEPLGTADAVLAAQAFAGDDPFLVLNSDNYYPAGVFAALGRLDGPGVAGFFRSALLASGQIPPERVAAFALLDADDRGGLRRIVEKPSAAVLERAGPDPLIGMNCWRFGPRIFEACRSIAPSPRGELELPAAVQLTIDRMGERYVVIPFRLPVLDLSTRGDIESVRRALANVTVAL